MMKKLLSLMLILLSGSVFAVDSVWGKDPVGQDQLAAKIKREICKLGVDAPVTLKLRDGSKLSGRIGEIGEDSVVLLTPVKGDRTARLTNRIVITYVEVRQVKYAGRPSQGANLGPAFLIFGVVILLKTLIH
jgi:hypothetical protein